MEGPLRDAGFERPVRRGYSAEVRDNESGETLFYVLAYRKSREDLTQDLRQVGITDIQYID